MLSIGTHRFEDVVDFVCEHGANRREMTDAYHVALWLEGAPAAVKHAYFNLADGVDTCWLDEGLRICDKCGKFMTEGYILGEFEYYCSDECAIQSYIDEVYNADSPDGKITHEQAETMLHYDLESNPDDNFWTEWYCDL